MCKILAGYRGIWLAASMIDFFFDYTRFVPRDCCGTWDGVMQWIYVVSNLAISGAYVALAAALITTEKISWQTLANDWYCRLSFAAFIICCGVGHMEGVLSFRWPAYHAFATWHAITAIVSWATVFVLVERNAHFNNEDYLRRIGE